MRAYPLHTHYIYYNNNLTEWRQSKPVSFEALMGRGKFSIQSIWQVKVPTDVAFFPWTTALDRILIVNNLWNRDMHFQTK